MSSDTAPAASAVTLTGLSCLRCHTLYPPEQRFDGCPRCRAQGVAVNLTCAYEYTLSGEPLRALFQSAQPSGLWRYAALLPVPRQHAVSLGEGGTPLLSCQRLGARWGVPHLLLKDETGNPTWSYKDRLNAVVVAKAVEWAAPAVVVSSTGNHGASTAAYAARAGMPCIALTIAAVPDTMKTLMQSYGASLVATQRSQDRWLVMRECVRQFGWVPTSNYMDPPIGSNPYGIEGYKTLAYEICEQLGWTVPGTVVMPVAYGDGLFGAWKGFRELHELGVVASVPQMVAAEPVDRLNPALVQGLEVPAEVPAEPSPAFSIAGGYSTYQALLALRQSGGYGTMASTDEIIAAQRDLARSEGIYVEASSATALAVVKKLAGMGRIAPDCTVVAVLTSTGLKDPAATARYLPPVPIIEPDLASLHAALASTYAFHTPAAAVSRQG